METKKILPQIIRIAAIPFILSILLNVTAAEAASVTLRWDVNNPAPDGCKVFARRADQSYNYSQPNWKGSATTCTLDNLTSQTEYYFVVRAYNGSVESSDSNEVRFVPTTSTGSATDTLSPSWNGATSGVGSVINAGTGGRVTVEFDTARDSVDGGNLKFNIYYAASKSWSNADWTKNNMILHAKTTAGSTFSHAVTVSGLTNGVGYTFGVRVEDQSGNEDANTHAMTATPTVIQTSSGSSGLLASKFKETTLRKGLVFYTDRDYVLTSVPSAYLGLDAILTPNDERGETAASGYLTFVMPQDGMVYVAFDSRATSLPNWLRSFSDTGQRIYTSLSSQPHFEVYQKWYASGATVNLGGNQASGFSGGTVSNYLVFYGFGSDSQSSNTSTTTTPSTTTNPAASLDAKFKETTLKKGMVYYTDRDYTLTSVPSSYLDLDAILTPNDERGETAAGGYLTFVMPQDGMVYVAFDSRATSLPNWLRSFSDTGKRIYTSLSSQPHLKVYGKWYASGTTVDLGGNQASGFSGGTISNYLVFY